MSKTPRAWWSHGPSSGDLSASSRGTRNKGTSSVPNISTLLPNASSSTTTPTASPSPRVCPLFDPSSFPQRSGEHVLISVDALTRPTITTIYVTNLRLAFRDSATGEIVWQYLAEIASVVVDQGDPPNSTAGMACIRILCSDLRVIQIWVSQKSSSDTSSLNRSLSTLRQVLSQRPIYAAVNREIPPDPSEWFVWECEREVARTRVPFSDWRLHSQDSSYTLSPTYPRKLVVPAAVSDDWLAEHASQYACKRFPVLVWHSSAPSGGLLCRSFAPSCAEAYGIIEHIARYRSVMVADTGTKGNTLGLHSSVIPLNLARPRQVRDAFFDFVQQQQQQQLQQLLVAGSTSQWMLQIGKLFVAVAGLAQLTNKLSVVLQHSPEDFFCDSDCQVSSLLQLVCDPHYRTMRGFLVLVDKEWLALGYPFALRSSYDADPEKTPWSPVFAQFVCAAACLVNDYCSAFEFTDGFLLALLDVVHSGRFGTFLANSEAERLPLRGSTPSAWTYLLRRSDEFLNPLYKRLEGSLNITAKYEPHAWNPFLLRRHPAAVLSAKRLRERTATWDKNTTSVDASGLELFAVPDAILGMKNLKSLNLSNNGLSAVPATLGCLASLCSLDLSDNAIRKLGPGVVSVLSYSLWSLEVLNLAGNQLTQLPEELKALSSLRVLGLARNKFAEMPAVLCAMAGLVSLNLSGADLTGLVPGSSSGIPNKLPAFSETLSELKLSGCRLTQLEPEFFQLPALRKLDLSKNELRHLPTSFGKLVSLVELDLSHNKFDEVPRQVLEIDGLEVLSLDHNDLEEFPSALNRLSKLRKLGIVGNKQVEALANSIGQLISLEELDIRGTSVKELRPTMGLLTHLKELLLDESQLTYPSPDVVARGLPAMLESLRDRLRGNVTCYRMKLLLVGSENVGKTTLFRLLRGARRGTKAVAVAVSDPSGATPPEESHNVSTDGIKIEDWLLPMSLDEATGQSNRGKHAEVVLSVWDFAGQAVYGTTHQFFLSSRGAYIVVWNMEQPLDQSGIEQWVWSINSRAPGAPVILVGTHADRLPNSKVAKAGIQLAISRLQSLFRGTPLTGFPVSCLTKKGLVTLREGLEEVLRRHQYLRQEVPGSFLILEQLVLEERLKSAQPVVSWSTLQSLAASCGVQDVQRAAEFLNQTGTVVHFADDKELHDLIVIDPQWLSDLFCTLITTKGNFMSSRGILNTRSLLHLWKSSRFPPSMHAQLLTLLERFEIVFNVSRKKTRDLCADPIECLVPTMLPEPEPEADVVKAWPLLEECHIFHCGRVYTFKQFLPKGLFSRLMVRVLNATAGAEVKVTWRHGMVLRVVSRIRRSHSAPKIEKPLIPRDTASEPAELSEDVAYVLVEELVSQASIRASVRGPSPGNVARVIFDAVSSVFDEACRRSLEVLVPCIHCIMLNSAEPHMFPVEDCERAAVASEPVMYCRGNTVRTDSLVPDLAMAYAEVPKIEYKEIAICGLIGEGAAAVVHRGMYLGREVAVKELKIDPDNSGRSGSRVLGDFRREVWVMSGFRHPNIVQLIGLCTHPLCIVTEFVPHGNLYTYMHDLSKPLNMPLVVKIAFDVASAMSFLHSSTPPQLHRDLKSPNILLQALSEKEQAVAKVADFGLTGFAFTIALSVDNPIWLAPEVMQKEEPTTASDVYSFGVVLWELVTRRCFFGEVPFMAVVEEKVIAGERPAIPSSCPSYLSTMIRSCWAADPAQRPVFSDIVERLRDIGKDFPTVIMSVDTALEAKSKSRKSERNLPPIPCGPRGRKSVLLGSSPLLLRKDSRRGSTSLVAPPLVSTSPRLALPEPSAGVPSNPAVTSHFRGRSATVRSPTAMIQQLNSPCLPTAYSSVASGHHVSPRRAVVTTCLDKSIESPSGSSSGRRVLMKLAKMFDVSAAAESSSRGKGSATSTDTAAVSSPVAARLTTLQNARTSFTCIEADSATNPTGVWLGRNDGSVVAVDVLKWSTVTVTPASSCEPPLRAILRISDSLVLASCGTKERQQVKLLSSDGGVRSTLKLEATCFAQSPQTLWAGSRGGVLAWDSSVVMSGRELSSPTRVEIPGSGDSLVRAMAFDGDRMWISLGTSLAVIGGTKRDVLAILSAGSSKLVTAMTVAGKDTVWVAYDGGQVKVWVWDVSRNTATMRSVVDAHKGVVAGMAPLPELGGVVTCSTEVTLRIWNVNDCQVVCESLQSPHTKPLAGVCYLGPSEVRSSQVRLATLSIDGMLALWQVAV